MGQDNHHHHHNKSPYDQPDHLHEHHHHHTKDIRSVPVVTTLGPNDTVFCMASGKLSQIRICDLKKIV